MFGCGCVIDVVLVHGVNVMGWNVFDMLMIIGVFFNTIMWTTIIDALLSYLNGQCLSNYVVDDFVVMMYRGLMPKAYQCLMRVGISILTILGVNEYIR